MNPRAALRLPGDDPGGSRGRLPEFGAALGIVVPVFNEETLLAPAVEHLLATAAMVGRAVQIVVVDDGSTDGSVAVARGLASRHAVVSVVECDVNRGFGAAVRAGLARLQTDIAMFCPADYRFSSQDFDVYLTLIRYADVVIGYRRTRRLALPFYPKTVSSVYHLIVSLLFNLNFFDVNWIHMYRRDVVDSALGATNGPFFLAETLIRAREKGFRIIGVDVDFTDRTAGRATGMKPTTILATIGEMLVFFFRHFRTTNGGTPS